MLADQIDLRGRIERHLGRTISEAEYLQAQAALAGEIMADRPLVNRILAVEPAKRD